MTHLNIGKTHPAPYKAVVELDARATAAATEAGLSSRLIKLVKIRASQINGCAFCLKLHTRDALQNEEAWERLVVLPAWRESQFFTSQEQAALHLTKNITRISDHGLRPEEDPTVAEHLTAEQISAVTSRVTTRRSTSTNPASRSQASHNETYRRFNGYGHLSAVVPNPQK